VPATLDWDFGKGRAAAGVPDNVHPYNWHWFRNYGTGETLNNGTHEVDVCAGVGWISEASDGVGGRYHFQDDWQFYDTR